MKSHSGSEFAKGEELPLVPFIGAASDSCVEVEDGGQFPEGGPYAYTGWDTTSSGDNFDNGGLCSAGSYGTGYGGNDQVVMFTVASDGLWNFWTCGYTSDLDPEEPAGWDTTLQIFVDGGAGCPTTQTAFEAQAVACDGDGCGNAAFESDMYAALFAAETYYLILDGWASPYNGTAWVVFYKAGNFCTNDTQCDDGNGCNGPETCNHQYEPELEFGNGLCDAGPGSPCLSYQSCVVEEGDNEYTCENPDPCMAFLQHDQNSTYFGPARANGNDMWANEVAYRVDAGRELVNYSVCISGRGQDIEGCAFDFTTSLWTVEATIDGGGDEDICQPLAMIPGTECGAHQEVDAGGTPCHYFTCTPEAGVILPDNAHDPNDPMTDELCGVDVYMAVYFSDESAVDEACDSHGLGLAAHLPTVGSSPFAAASFLPNQSDGTGWETGRTVATGKWDRGYFSHPSVSDFANSDICTVPVGACCYDAGGCELVQEEADCVDGDFAGISTLPDPHSCLDPDGDGFYNTCDNCPDDANPEQEDCNDDGTGDACETDVDLQDSDGDGCCNGVDECPDDPLKCEVGQCGCGVEDIDSDEDGTANCNDDCYLDAGKTAPGCCGCGFVDTDVDEDGYTECEPGADVQDIPMCPDTCPNVDDGDFGPCDPGVIPTVSEWGLVIMALLLLVAGKVYFGRRTAIG